MPCLACHGQPQVKGIEARWLKFGLIRHCVETTHTHTHTFAQTPLSVCASSPSSLDPSICGHVSIHKNVNFICASKQNRRSARGCARACARACVSAESVSERSLLYNPSRGPSAIFVPGYASRLGIFSGD